MGMWWLWRTCAISLFLLWTVWSEVGQTIQETIRGQEQIEAGQQGAAIHCIRNASRRCTDLPVQFGRIRRNRRNRRNRSSHRNCRSRRIKRSPSCSTREAQPINQVTAAPPCKQNRQSGDSNRSPSSSSRRGQNNLAPVCPSNAPGNGRATCQMYKVPCSSHQGIGIPSSRIAWTFDPAAASHAPGTNADGNAWRTTSSSASTASVSSLGSSEWNESANICRSSTNAHANGRRYTYSSTGEWISNPPCRYAVARYRSSSQHNQHACNDAPDLNGLRLSSAQSGSMSTGTTTSRASDSGSRHSTGQLDLAASNAKHAQHECPRLDIGTNGHDEQTSRSRLHTCQRSTRRTCTEQRSNSAIASTVQCCHQSTPPRSRRITRFSPDLDRSSSWPQSAFSRTRRRRRTRTFSKAPGTTYQVCTTATAMPSGPYEFPWPGKSNESTVNAAASNNSTHSTSHSGCVAGTTARSYHTSSIPCSRSGISAIIARCKHHANPTCKSYVHQQLSGAANTSTSDENRDIFHFPKRPKTAEGIQESARPSSFSAKPCIPAASVRIRWIQSGPHTGPNGSCHRRGSRARAISRVGLVICEDRLGPNDLCAVPTGTNASPVSCKDVHSLLDNDARVTLSLSNLLDFDWQDEALHAASALFDRLCAPWPDTCLIRDPNFVMLLPDLQPEIRWIFKDLPRWQQEPVSEVHIYVDGSSFENRQQMHYERAAWAFIVIVKIDGKDNDGCQFFAAVSNPLSEADMSADEFYGVGELARDPLSAEAAGMLMVQSWICQSPFTCLHVVHYDNCTVGRCAEGTARWHAKWEHECLHTNLCAMRHCLEAVKWSIQYEHVKAHEGNPMNEIADSLAKATAKGIFGKLPLPVEVSRVFHHRHFKYAWMTISSSRAIPKPAALRGLFKAEGPFVHSKVDTTWWHPNIIETTDDVHVSVQVATANVLTLEPGPKSMQLQGLMQQGRISMLQQQFQNAGIHAIGLQECRTQGQAVRHSPTHWVFQSGATTDGARGCELWLSKQIAYTVNTSNPCYFAAEHVHIAVANDRCLLAIVKAPHFHVRFLVTHAPHQAAHDVTCESWWTDLQHIVQRIGNHLPLIVLGDMNAKIGSVQSDAIGSLGAEDENGNGCRLHSFALDNELWIPSTFSLNHQGTTTTWRSSEGQPHRLDFILVPSQWKSFEVQSFVSPDVDLCIAREDHSVVCLKVSMLQRQSKSRKITKPRIDVSKCTDAQAKAKFIHHLQHPPEIPWETGAGQHAEVLTAWLQATAQQCFPRSSKQPKQRYMSEFTWQIVLLRKQMRRLMLNAEHHVNLLRLRLWFTTWAHLKTSNQSNSRLAQTPMVSVLSVRSLIQKFHSTFAWALFHRQKLHTVARNASKQDRIQVTKTLVDNFFQVAHSNDSRALYRHLKPLLGQQHRKAVHQFRPIPAVRLEDSSLAKNHDEAANRWQMHFAVAEQGTPVTVQQMQEIANLEQPRYQPQDLRFDLGSIPSLQDIENYIHKAKVGKSPGLDGLPSELYRLAPSVLAPVLWPLMAKCAVRCTEPLRWRGGEVCAIPKVVHASTQVEHFRSILLADFSSKICHGMIRSRLLPAVQNYRLNMQAGGIPGLGTDMLHLFVQSFMQHTKHQGVSSAALFVDIKQAFYRACRPLLVTRHVSQEALTHLFASNGWSQEMFQAFRARLNETPALAQARVSPHQIAQVDATLSTTWFQLRSNPSTLTHTACGTRPGDSIADLLFTFIMSRFLLALHSKFVQAGLHNTFQLQWIPPADIQPGDVEEQVIIQACWVDDLVILLQAPTATDLVDKIRVAITITQDLSVEFGLSLNYGPDKTAVLPAFRGPDYSRTQITHNLHSPANRFQAPDFWM